MAKILVVDDHAPNRELIVALMGYSGHQSIEASDGSIALEQVRAERPDLVICDILMPTMDGYEFVRQLRADAAIAQTEVVFYTATFMEREARSLAHACGVSNVLIKPCEPQEILRVVEHALAHASSPEMQPDAEQFDREHLRLLTDKLALKVSELECANQRLSALTDLNLQLASERDPYVLLDKVCRGARDLLGARYSVLGVRDKHGAADQYMSTWGLAPEQSDQVKSLGIEGKIFREVMADGRARRFSQSDPASSTSGLPDTYPPAQSILLAPVMSLNRIHGWILLVDKLGSPAFTLDDEHLLTIHAAQAGRIYENGSLYNEIKRTAEQLQIEIVERRLAAEALVKANETLEHRVQLRTAELSETIDGLETFNRNVSHDIRGPLGGIASAAKMAQALIEGNQKDKAIRLLQAVAAQATMTEKVVESLLALARTSNVTLRTRNVDMNALLSEVVESIRQARSVGTIPVTQAPLPEIEADLELARQVFVNLIGNALKFAAEVGKPQVEVGVIKSADQPVFFVRDNGVGFDPEQAKRLFKPFQRMHDARFEGSGVGLSIVKRIIDRHGGKVWAEGTPGQGATFYFSFGESPLPCSQAT
ncbi:ATP-binding protein [Aquabacterium sp.]|uniref:ATP-binding protein n=1 Tax=Aquabacterium sp. TaxID=1872578 RepID=UPI002487DB38|nr:ATP-binding protein [Aquabacterium sp.]MDI1260770.1 response regulator [Aquabacterium sp.]